MIYTVYQKDADSGDSEQIVIEADDVKKREDNYIFKKWGESETSPSITVAIISCKIVKQIIGED